MIARSVAGPAPSRTSREHWIEGTSGPRWQPRLLLREQVCGRTGQRGHVLYVHGATFPSASSVLAKFGGKSWADALNDAGFGVFALDFAGYGGSERYPGMSLPADQSPPLGRASEAAEQIARAVALIRRRIGAEPLSIVAHSWGTIPAAIFATAYPESLCRLVLFGPILRRCVPHPKVSDAWSLVTIAAQHQRFTKDVPPRHGPVLEEPDFPDWAEAYLRSDPESLLRTPPAVQVPGGPSADVAAAWSGELPYDPAALRTAVMLVRGEWDSSSTAADVDWFAAALPPSLERKVVTIARATHLMHLERGRHELYETVNAFLHEANA